MYYKILAPDFGFGLFFTVLSIITALKISKVTNINEKIIYFVISYISLFVFVLGTYQPFIDTILVILSGKLLLDYTGSEYKVSSIKEYIKEHKYFFIVLILSVISEFWIIKYLKVINRLEVNGNSSLINFLSIEEVKNYFIFSLKLIYKLLFTTFPYIGMYIKVLLFTIILFAFIFMLIKIFRIKIGVVNKLQKILIFTFLFVLTAWLSLFSYFIAPGYDFENILLRVNHIGYDIFYLLCFVILIKFVKSDIFKKAVIILSLLIIYNSGINTIYAQQISDMGFNAEMQFQNRVLSRIEQHPNFSYGKIYENYIFLGRYPSFKTKFYSGPKYNYEFIELFFMSDICDVYLTPYNYFVREYNNPPGDKIINYLKKRNLPDEIKDYILNTAKAWPDKDSVYVSDEYIIVVFDEGVLERSKGILIENRAEENE